MSTRLRFAWAVVAAIAVVVVPLRVAEIAAAHAQVQPTTPAAPTTTAQR